MIKIQLGKILLGLDISNGLYIFDEQGAIGKTYFGRLLKLAHDAELLNCYTFTYDSEQTEEMIIEKIKLLKPEFLFLDRYDLYATKALSNFLKEYSKNAVVLLDLKNYNKLFGRAASNVTLLYDGKEMIVKK